MMDDSVTVTATGTRTASGAASAGTTIPLCSSGEVPRYIIVSATAAAHFRLGAGAQTSVNTDLMIQPGDARIMSVPSGYTNYACIQAVAAGVVQVSPLENM